MLSRSIAFLQCNHCSRRYDQEEIRYTCPTCGPQGTLKVQYNYDQIRDRFRNTLKQSAVATIWRYQDLLPLENPPPTSVLAVGGTPLYTVERVRANLKMPTVWIKDDTRNPSASLKDRASILAVLLANGQHVSCASTGNAAASLAIHASSQGLACSIFVPYTAPTAKIVQLLICGATVFSVQGTYDDAFDLCIEACNTFGWYNRNTGYNPYMVEGKKTVALEIAEQLNWDVPDSVFVPTGDGCILSGVYRGFEDLLQMGMITHIPRLIAVQAEGSSAIVEAVKTCNPIQPSSGITIADGLAVQMPRNGEMAVACIRASGGFGITVTDNEILTAAKSLAMLTGIFAEPSGAAAYAGLLRALAEEKIAHDERVVLIITGSGLKNIDAIRISAGNVIPVPVGLEGIQTVAKYI